MYCIYCGTELPNHAKFCSQCGKQVDCKPGAGVPAQEAEAPEAGMPEFCEMVYVPVQEKIGLFPKEKGRFEVISGEGEERQVLAASPVFDLDSLNLYGPQEKNARHREPMEALAASMKEKGWVQQKKPGFAWYNLKFRRNK